MQIRTRARETARFATDWQPTRRVWLYGAAVAVAAAICCAALLDWTAGLSILFAAALVALAVSLPGKTPEGVFVGLATSLVASLTWTSIYHPTAGRALQAVVALVLLVWAFPWLRSLRELPRLGTAWLALGYWVSGVIGAALSLRLGVSASRVLIGGVFGVVALVLVQSYRRRGRDASVGLVAGFLVMLAVLVISGLTDVFHSQHFTPPNEFGYRFGERFWGSSTLLLHPNAIGALASIVALRVTPDNRFRPWQRVAAAAVAVSFLDVTDSRTAILMLLASVNLWWWVTLLRRGGLVRRRLGSLPKFAGFVLASCAVLLAVTGFVGDRTLFEARYAPPTSTANRVPTLEPEIGAAGDVTSGRLATWRTVISDFRHDPVVQQVFGHANTPRAAIAHINANGERTEISPDNAPLTAFRIGGVLGAVTFLGGLLLLLWHALRRDAPVWFTVYAFGACASMATANWLLGDTLWQVLITAEAALVGGAFRGSTAARLSAEPHGHDREADSVTTHPDLPHDLAGRRRGSPA